MLESRSPWVLLVDDHQDGRELLGEFLSMSGFAVETLESGEEALSLIADRGAPSVLVTDLTLGSMSGAELARRLRDDPATASLPILAVTGHAGYRDPEKLFSAVLIKPVELTALVAAVKSATSLS